MIIYGSKFLEDRSEQYTYRILSQIILCMESGRWLILKDLEEIYGSLYGKYLLSYTRWKSNIYCRHAQSKLQLRWQQKKLQNCSRYYLINTVLLHSYSHTGPYSNPMCHVADGFRCIVLVDAKKIDFTDPPFLNRFEKQSFAYL